MDPRLVEECYQSALSEDKFHSHEELMHETNVRYAQAINAVYQHGEVAFDESNTENPICYQKYSFLPFKASTEIRLLRIDGFVRLGAREYLSIQIEHADLDQSPEYNALSYAWGPIDDTWPVIINHTHCLMVTKTLVSVLYRASSNDRLCWTDQLCIDQYSPSERSSQVVLMGRIYAQASSTIIWLGEEDETSTAVHNLLQQLIPPQGHLEIASVIRATYWGTRDQWQANSDPQNPPFKTVVPSPDHSCWQDLQEFMKRPWFSRLWVFQEALLSKKPILACGTQLFDLHGLWLACALKMERCHPNDLPPGQKMLMDLVIYRMAASEGSYPGLAHTLFHVAGKLKCKDSRDKIYGLLAVSSASSNNTFSVSYTKPVTQIYVDFTRQIIDVSKDLHILMYLKEEPLQDQLIGLPSWVPNWNVESTCSPIQGISGRYSGTENALNSKFNACKSNPYCASKSSSATSLIVHGGVVDFIESKLSHNFHIFDYPANWIDYYRGNFPVMKFIEELQALDGPGSSKTLSIEMVKQIIIRTLTADGFNYGLVSVTESAEPPTLETSRLSAKEIAEMWDFFVAIIEDEGEGEKVWREQYPKFGPIIRKLQVCTEVCENKALFALRNRSLGLCPKLAARGDLIAILHGLVVPVVLRPVQQDGDRAKRNHTTDTVGESYQIIGQCFVDGIMFGEAVDWLPEDQKTFILV